LDDDCLNDVGMSLNMASRGFRNRTDEEWEPGSFGLRFSYRTTTLTKFPQYSLKRGTLDNEYATRRERVKNAADSLRLIERITSYPIADFLQSIGVAVKLKFKDHVSLYGAPPMLPVVHNWAEYARKHPDGDGEVTFVKRFVVEGDIMLASAFRDFYDLGKSERTNRSWCFVHETQVNAFHPYWNYKNDYKRLDILQDLTDEIVYPFAKSTDKTIGNDSTSEKLPPNTRVTAYPTSKQLWDHLVLNPRNPGNPWVARSGGSGEEIGTQAVPIAQNEMGDRMPTMLLPGPQRSNTKENRVLDRAFENQTTFMLVRTPRLGGEWTFDRFVQVIGWFHIASSQAMQCTTEEDVQNFARGLLTSKFPSQRKNRKYVRWLSGLHTKYFLARSYMVDDRYRQANQRITEAELRESMNHESSILDEANGDGRMKDHKEQQLDVGVVVEKCVEEQPAQSPKELPSHHSKVTPVTTNTPLAPFKWRKVGDCEDGKHCVMEGEMERETKEFLCLSMSTEEGAHELWQCTFPADCTGFRTTCNDGTHHGTRMVCRDQTGVFHANEGFVEGDWLLMKRSPTAPLPSKIERGEMTKYFRCLAEGEQTTQAFLSAKHYYVLRRMDKGMDGSLNSDNLTSLEKPALNIPVGTSTKEAIEDDGVVAALEFTDTVEALPDKVIDDVDKGAYMATIVIDAEENIANYRMPIPLRFADNGVAANHFHKHSKKKGQKKITKEEREEASSELIIHKTFVALRPANLKLAFRERVLPKLLSRSGMDPSAECRVEGVANQLLMSGEADGTNADRGVAASTNELIKQKIALSVEVAMGFLMRVFVSVAHRFLRLNIVEEGFSKGLPEKVPVAREMKKPSHSVPVATYLCGMTEGSEPYLDSLGCVNQSTPMPCPIRSYDVTTLFSQKQARNTFPQFCGSGKPTNDDDGEFWLNRCKIDPDKPEITKRVLLNSVLLRTTGKVDAIADYFLDKTTRNGNALVQENNNKTSVHENNAAKDNNCADVDVDNDNGSVCSSDDGELSDDGSTSSDESSAKAAHPWTKVEDCDKRFVLFDEEDCDLLPAYMAVRSGDETGEKRGIAMPCISTQFEDELPLVVRLSARRIRRFWKMASNNISSTFLPWINRQDGVDIDAKEAVQKMHKCLTRSRMHAGWLEGKSGMFLAAQIISDIGEVFSGTKPGSTPFVGEYVVAGYGGGEGFSVFRSPEETFGGVSNDKKERISPHERKTMAIKAFVDYVNKDVDCDRLLLFGMCRVNKTTGIRSQSKGRDDRELFVAVVALNGRAYSHVDVEHMMCKVYIGCSRYRGTRGYTEPDPSRHFCHPPVSRIIFGGEDVVGEIMKIAIDQYKKIFQEGSLQPLENPFVHDWDVDEEDEKEAVATTFEINEEEAGDGTKEAEEAVVKNKGKKRKAKRTSSNQGSGKSMAKRRRRASTESTKQTSVHKRPRQTQIKPTKDPVQVEGAQEETLVGKRSSVRIKINTKSLSQRLRLRPKRLDFEDKDTKDGNSVDSDGFGQFPSDDDSEDEESKMDVDDPEWTMQKANIKKGRRRIIQDDSDSMEEDAA